MIHSQDQFRRILVFSRFSLMNNFNMLLTNCSLLVFGGLYMLPNIICLPFLHFTSIKMDSVCPSSNTSKSCLLLYAIPSRTSMDTPPPFFSLRKLHRCVKPLMFTMLYMFLLRKVLHRSIISILEFFFSVVLIS